VNKYWVKGRISHQDLETIAVSMTTEEHNTMVKSIDTLLGDIGRLRDYESFLLSRDMLRKGYLASFATYIDGEEE
jgi:hypothetical protein